MEEKLTKDEYDKYAALCECGMRIVLARIENLRQEAEITTTSRNLYAGIQHRIKTYESVMNKCADRGLPGRLEDIRAMHDIAGSRIITLYKDDVYRVRDALVRQPSIEILEERDYIENPKDNGYRSLHLIISVHVYFCETTKSVPVEIQIRTKAMDLWASVEHNCKYKNDAPSKDAPAMFAKIAQILEEFDENAIRLRDDSACQS